jgi:hypothetical protein
MGVRTGAAYVLSVTSATRLRPAERRTPKASLTTDPSRRVIAPGNACELVVRCVLLPAVLELLGPLTWRLPQRLDSWLPHINIAGGSPASGAVGDHERLDGDCTRERTPIRT